MTGSLFSLVFLVICVHGIRPGLGMFTRPGPPLSVFSTPALATQVWRAKQEGKTFFSPVRWKASGWR
jgi:hypothetical protein